MKDLKAMMGKDDSGDQMKKDAKLSVLKQLRQMAADMVGGDVKSGMEGMKKVTVAAPDKQGLAEGLDKAKQLMGGHADLESPEEDMNETPEDEALEDSGEDMDHDTSMDQEDEDMTPEEIQKKIQDLQMMLKMKSR